MDETSEVDEPEVTRPERMPRKVLAAVIALWVSAAATLLATVSIWLTLNAAGELGDYLYFYPFRSLSVPILGVLAVLAALELRAGVNRGRITGIVVAIWGTLIALNQLVVGIEFWIALVAYIVLLSTLFSADVKAWCGRPPRAGGREPRDPIPPAL